MAVNRRSPQALLMARKGAQAKLWLVLLRSGRLKRNLAEGIAERLIETLAESRRLLEQAMSRLSR